MPDPPADRRPVVAHLGRVAGRGDERSLGDGIDHATPPHPALRMVTVGHAVTARLLTG